MIYVINLFLINYFYLVRLPSKSRALWPFDPLAFVSGQRSHNPQS